MTASPRIGSGQRVSSPLQAAFESHPGDSYQYNFSASTIARAEKAKVTLELMAEYRRLLQYLPPLTPQALERTTTTSPPGTSAGSPVFALSNSHSTLAPSARQLGRIYNPLQYIRNRKVRARNSRTIDGEAQGFGDVDKVASWVDLVAQEASSADYPIIPSFSKEAEDAASPHASPQSTLGKGQIAPARIKRPRVDWITNPADMIADVFWLEQDDNKRFVEDRRGIRIFPPTTDLKRPMSLEE